MISATLDSNIYKSAPSYRGIGARLLGMARAGQIRIDASDAILSETNGVLRDKYRWEGYRLHFAGIELRKFVRLVVPTQVLTVADDADDNRILECAVEAGWGLILTCDEDLLRLLEYARIRIMRPDEFLGRGRCGKRI